MLEALEDKIAINDKFTKAKTKFQTETKLENTNFQGFINRHFLSPGAKSGIRTLNLRIMSRVVYRWTYNGTARLKNENNCLNTDIYSYLVTPGG